MTDSEKDQEKVREPTKSPADAQQSATEGDQHSKPSLQTVLDDGQEKEQYPHGITLGLITLALCLAVFLMALDNTIIATAIPKITDYFSSLDDVGWYGSAYLLTTASFQLMFGKFYTYSSIKWTFIAAITIFEIGSLVCGTAPTSNALIIGRAVAGIGSAGVFSGALVIIAHSVPLRKRPMFTGIIGAMYGLASVAGPLLGGVFTDKVTWRWCFYINLPIGAVTLLVIALFFTAPRRPKSSHIENWRDGLKKFDSWGTVAFLPAVICLLLALQWGGTTYPWRNGRIIALFVIFGVLITVFVGIQVWKKDDATVPPRILTQRSIFAGSLFAFSLGASFFIMVYFIPIWFQAIKGTSAVGSGIDSLPMILSVVVASLVSGGIISVTGYYTPWMILGSILASIGAGLISTFKPDTTTGAWIGFQIIYGAGIGSGMQQPLMAAQTVLPLVDVPSGTAIIVFMQTIGGAIFISIAQNVFTNKLVSGVLKNAPGIDPGLVVGAGATGIKNAIPQEHFSAVVSAYNLALVNAFYVATAMSCLTFVASLAVEWRSVKSGSGPSAMHAA